MKHAIFGTVLFTISIVVILIIVTISGRMTRKQEINSTLTLALDNAVENVMIEHNYSIEDKDEFIADVLESLIYTYHSDSTIEIKIAKADYTKGLLAIKAVEHYKNANGSDSTYEAEKVVIFEESVNVKYYTATFYNEDNTILIEYKICSEDKCLTPEIIPTGSDAFYGWKRKLNGEDGKEFSDELSDEDIKSITMKEDLKFYPVFR